MMNKKLVMYWGKYKYFKEQVAKKFIQKISSMKKLNILVHVNLF
jgi:hypothetical protein